MLVWSLTFLAALDSLGLPLQWVVKGLGASTVVLGILASVVLRDTVANYFGGLVIIAVDGLEQLPYEALLALVTFG